MSSNVYLAAYWELQGERLVDVNLKIVQSNQAEWLHGVFSLEGERLAQLKEAYARCQADANLNRLIGSLATLQLRCIELLIELRKANPECPVYRVNNLDFSAAVDL